MPVGGIALRDEDSVALPSVPKLDASTPTKFDVTQRPSTSTIEVGSPSPRAKGAHKRPQASGDPGLPSRASKSQKLEAKASDGSCQRCRVASLTRCSHEAAAVDGWTLEDVSQFVGSVEGCQLYVQVKFCDRGGR